MPNVVGEYAQLSDEDSRYSINQYLTVHVKLLYTDNNDQPLTLLVPIEGRRTLLRTYVGVVLEYHNANYQHYVESNPDVARRVRRMVTGAVKCLLGEMMLCAITDIGFTTDSWMLADGNDIVTSEQPTFTELAKKYVYL